MLTKEQEEDLRRYPMWICMSCGDKYGNMPKDHVCTIHPDTCGWCGRTNVPCTEPRDFRWPNWPVKTTPPKVYNKDYTSYGMLARAIEKRKNRWS